MLLIQNKITIIFLVSLIFLFVFGSGIALEAVTAKECKEAHHECMVKYRGYLPVPWGAVGQFYCGIGYVFCLLYM